MTIVLLADRLSAILPSRQVAQWTFGEAQRTIKSFIEVEDEIVAGTKQGELIVFDRRSGKVLATAKTDWMLRPKFHLGKWQTLRRYRLSEVTEDRSPDQEATLANPQAAGELVY